MLYAEKMWKICNERNKEKDQRQEYWMWRMKRKAITSSLLLVPANKSQYCHKYKPGSIIRYKTLNKKQRSTPLQ